MHQHLSNESSITSMCKSCRLYLHVNVRTLTFALTKLQSDRKYSKEVNSNPDGLPLKVMQFNDY